MKTTPRSTKYRNWLRMGIRMFDDPTVLRPDERARISWMSLEELEIAAELCGLDLTHVRKMYRK